MPLPQIRAGLQLGAWELVTQLGYGGNGEVWRAKQAGSGDVIAIKILTKVKETAYKRFRHETSILRQLAGLTGVVQILAENLPDDFKEERAWYVMPLGVPLPKALATASLVDIVGSFRQIASAMAVMHSKEITHRDVKPANCILIDGKGCLGDFGLVDYPEKEDLTGKHEDIGPRWTMAPEVWRHGPKTDGKAADVYSLAKSLWILATKQNQGFDGVYDPYGKLGLRRFRKPREFIGPLDSLLVLATDHDPNQRPTMQQFADELSQWLSLDGQFHEQNRFEWEELRRRLFPFGAPAHVEWTNLEDIALVLSVLGERSNMNHMFYPNGGGMDIETAYLSPHEEGCIEIHAGGIDLLRPAKLTFDAIRGGDLFNYFRLELAELKPSNVYEPRDGRRYEEVLRLGNSSHYVDRSHYDYGEYDERPLPEGSRVVSRFFNGSFVITSKASPYNLAHGKWDAYDARHDKMSPKEFREHMQQLSDAFSDFKQKKLGPGKPI